MARQKLDVSLLQDQSAGADEDNYVLTYDNSTGSISLEAASGGGASGAGFFQGENGNTGDTSNGKGDIFRTHESTLNSNTTLGTAGNTSGGANAVVSRAKIIEQKVLANIEEYVEDLSNIIVEFISKVFGGETIYTRSEKKTDGSFDFNRIEVPKIDMKNFQYTFAVNLDVKTPYSKDQNKQLMLELFQMERQYNQGEPIITNVLDVMKQYNLPERKELMNRYKEMLTKDTQTKAQIISEITAAAEQYGIDQQMLLPAITEVIEGKRETPALDQLFAMIEQGIRQKETQQVEQARMQAQASQPATGEEQFTSQESAEQPELTGDETFNIA